MVLPNGIVPPPLLELENNLSGTLQAPYLYFVGPVPRKNSALFFTKIGPVYFQCRVKDTTKFTTFEAFNFHFFFKVSNIFLFFSAICRIFYLFL
jgi:hypothetical protein